MIEYAQTVRCRSRYILEYFGEAVAPDWRCHHCDACDALDDWAKRESRVSGNGKREETGPIRVPERS